MSALRFNKEASYRLKICVVFTAFVHLKPNNKTLETFRFDSAVLNLKTIAIEILEPTQIHLDWIFPKCRE